MGAYCLLSSSPWKRHEESRADAKLAGHGDGAAEPAEDLPHHRQPEAGAAIAGLGRHIRLEDPFELILRNAHAIYAIAGNRYE